MGKEIMEDMSFHGSRGGTEEWGSKWGGGGGEGQRLSMYI